MRKRHFFAALLCVLGTASWGADSTVTVGVTAGPHAQIAEVARRVAQQQGVQVRLVEFSDYIQPNAALAQGDLDANVYQHVPFMQMQNKDRGYQLTAVAKAVNQQMGVYSFKVKNLADLPQGARVGIPNDPSNGSRALLVLAAQQLIALKPGVQARATVLDIASNPKKLRFVELEAAQLAHSLRDLDAAAVNSNYAVAAGLAPQTDALALESVDTPYVTVYIVSRQENENSAAVQAFVRAYQSDEVKAFIAREFKGAYTAAW